MSDDAPMDWTEIERKARLVDTARRVYGRKAARALWVRLGLPDVGAGSRRGPDPAVRAIVEAFVDERLALDPGARLRAGEAHQAYLAWAVANGAPALSVTAFGLAMNVMPVTKSRGRHVTYAARLT